jgi:hypothetical protein
MKIIYQLSKREAFGFLGCIQFQLSVLVEVEWGRLASRTVMKAMRLE